MNGVLLEMNGTVCLDTGYYVNDSGGVSFDPSCLEDRQVALNRSIALLRSGQNLFLWPEGAWNLTANQIVQKLYPGFVRMHFESGADIIPVGIERYGKRYAVIMGRNIDFREMTRGDIDIPYMSDMFDEAEGSFLAGRKLDGADPRDTPLDPSDDRDAIVRYLRDAIATLKWMIMEREPRGNRAEISADYERMYVDDIMSESEPYYSEELIRQSRFRDKNAASADEVFDCFRYIIPRHNNAFVFRGIKDYL